MQLGMVGLGRMGANMTRRLMHGGHTMVVSDLSADAVKSIAGEGAVASSSLDDLVGKLSAPRAVWIMVPAGEPTEKTVQALVGCMQAGDTIIDGGNSYFKDDVRRSKICAAKDVHYIDVGTSGGVWGLERGYCMMIGGPKPLCQRLGDLHRERLLRARVCPAYGWRHGGHQRRHSRSAGGLWIHRAQAVVLRRPSLHGARRLPLLH